MGTTVGGLGEQCGPGESALLPTWERMLRGGRRRRLCPIRSSPTARRRESGVGCRVSGVAGLEVIGKGKAQIFNYLGLSL